MTVSVISDAWSFTFQLTSSQGGWRIRKGWYHLHILFNSHPHKEDDQTIHRQCPQYYLFNSHPHKEDDATSGSLRLWEVYFNSHPHKEDDEVIWATSCDIAFSTHILTRRMTCRQFADNRYRVFQLTSSQGGWRCGGIDHGEINTFFNSHPHKEDDSSSYCL